MGLHSDLKGLIPEDILRNIPDGYEIIGEIAIVSIPSSAILYQKEITTVILNRRPSVKTILNKVGKYAGMHRVPRFHALYGTDTKTEHQEYGFRYKLDILTVYFSTKLASERIRIASLISPEESIFIPFAGIGPYAIPVAKRGAQVIGVEINPDACVWMKSNIVLNNVLNNIQIIRGDAFHAPDYLKRKFSRIIIPTPYGLMDTPDIFLDMLSNGGIAHWITFCNKNQIVKSIQDLEIKGYRVQRIHRCGSIAPSVSRWILDIENQ